MVTKIGDTYYCKSSDTKPTGCVVNGQKLMEIDTSKTYYFDADGEEGSEWLEWGATPDSPDG